jgi:hypothetical protein
MHRITAALAAFVSMLALSGTAAAQSTTVIVREEVTAYPVFEAGVQAGVLTGLSAKYWLTPYQGIQGGFTWAFPDDGYSFNADYVAHSYALRRAMREPTGLRVPLYAGLGAKALRLSSDDPVYGARFPLGAQGIFEDVPVSIFAEIAPGAVFEREGPVFTADAGVGARVYF